ncbi:lipopolysaccharide kinase InaA family protein [Stutzerimonas kunmingensis]|uniref:lipopolysaccharide kinase InaA family protein n=1 Tax=Stutzerimonas kunmingensis TaxID=1211807 RepID=UPI00241CF139|nr:lipopolysaccharide kinase InaA family protein [Stutzerimonas kunmingensis]
MRTLTQSEFKKLSSNATVIELDGLGPKVLKLTDGSFLKLFRKRPFFSRETLKPYAKRFAENSARLKKLGFSSPKIIGVYRLVDPTNKTAVHYWPLPGQTLRQALGNSDAERRQQLIELFGELLAKLHTNGVYFRSVHLGNVLVQPDGQLGLIDLADMRISRFALSQRKRQRNLKHMQRYSEDQQWLFKEHLNALQEGYSRIAKGKTAKLLS